MIVIAGFLFGAIFGAIRARRRQGSGFDIAHYTATHAIAFTLLGTFLTILIEKLV
ncbi:MAG: apolipoprotein acyltransferase [Albidovulum sp.]